MPDLINGSMILLSGGSYKLGNDFGRSDERPAHTVYLDPYWVAPMPVTNIEYLRYVEDVGKETPPFIHHSKFNIPEQPVVGISWFDAIAYCDWISEQMGSVFRLPTEAEREFAARGGLVDCDWPWGSDSPEKNTSLYAVASVDSPHIPQPPCVNGYGLYCMGENVHEWCGNWYDRRGYIESPHEIRRASRGGSWRHSIKFTRVTARSSLNPNYRYNDYGFRLYTDG